MHLIERIHCAWKLRSVRRVARLSRRGRLAIEHRLRAAGALPNRAVPLFARLPAVAFACLILLLAGGTAAYAYESPAVAEGNALYPIKRGFEKLEERLAVASPEQRAEYHAKMASRRLREAEALKRSGDAKSAKHLSDAKKELEASFSAADETVSKGKKRDRLIERISRAHAEIAETVLDAPDAEEEARRLPLAKEVRALREDIRAQEGTPKEKRERFRQGVHALIRAKIDSRERGKPVPFNSD